SEAGKIGALDQQVAEKLAEAAETAATIAKLEAGLPILQQMVEMRRHLLDIQYGNRFALLEAQQQLIAQQRELPVQQRHAEAIAAARLALERQREQVRADYAHSVLGDLADAEKKRDELGHELAKATQKARQTVLVAPVSGSVQQLAVHTVGGVVTPAQPLLVIVPDDHPL